MFWFAYLRRYKSEELAVKTLQFGQRVKGRQGEIFEDEERGELRCRRQPWQWLEPLPVSRAWKTWLMKDKKKKKKKKKTE